MDNYAVSDFVNAILGAQARVTVEDVARRIFGADNVAVATPYMRSFLEERKRAEAEMPGKSHQEQFNAAIINWTIKTLVGLTKQVAGTYEMNQQTANQLANATLRTQEYRDRVEELEQYRKFNSDAWDALLARFGLGVRTDSLTGAVEVGPLAKVKSLRRKPQARKGIMRKAAATVKAPRKRRAKAVVK